VALAATGFTALASLDMLVAPARDAAPGDAGAWSHAHVLISTFGFSFLAVASLAGLGYLAKERALKHKNASARVLPSLESLDRLEHFALSLGFPLLTLGVVTGFVWVRQQGLSPWTGHTYWLLAAWTVYLLPVGLRVLLREHGEKPARTCVLGFLLLAFSYIGVRLIGVVA
jgi:ABC-type uncharacterized transport system permease subunit